MELGHVGTASFVGMVFQIIIGFGLPIALLIWVNRKQKAKISTFFMGGATFIVFALILESLLHRVVLGAAGTALTGNVWLYGLYGAFAAALFEETGRWVTMRFFMKKRLDTANALMYGVGHGGTEAILLVGLGGISNLITAAMINSGAIRGTLLALDADLAKTTLEQISVLWTTPAYQFFLGGVERVFAVSLQMAMSVFVFIAVKNRKKAFWGLSFAVHFFLDFITVVSMKYLPVWGVELLLGILTAIVVWLAFALYGREKAELLKINELSKLSELSE